MIGYIYKITNRKTGKIYIGSTKNPKEREYSHFSNLKLNKHLNKELQKDFNQFGSKNFKFEVVLKRKIKKHNDLIDIEMKYYIKFEHLGLYNKQMPGYKKIKHTAVEFGNVYLSLNI
jgi:group I intron endonuclease